jgi:hypothetical protein
MKVERFFDGKHFALTSDHWTSIANENYAALTLHLIEEFK